MRPRKKSKLTEQKDACEGVSPKEVFPRQEKAKRGVAAKSYHVVANDDSKAKQSKAAEEAKENITEKAKRADDTQLPALDALPTLLGTKQTSAEKAKKVDCMRFRALDALPILPAEDRLEEIPVAKATPLVSGRLVKL